MLHLAWLTIPQYVFQPALTGRLELISRKIASCEQGTKAIAVSRFGEKIVSHELGPKHYRDFAKNIALLGTKKWGPSCDRDVSTSPIYTTAIWYIESTLYGVGAIKLQFLNFSIRDIWWLVYSLHTGPVMWKPFLHHDVIKLTGPWFSIKTIFPRYGDSHVKDKTVGETVLSLTWESLYW